MVDGFCSDLITKFESLPASSKSEIANKLKLLELMSVFIEYLSDDHILLFFQAISAAAHHPESRVQDKSYLILQLLASFPKFCSLHSPLFIQFLFFDLCSLLPSAKSVCSFLFSSHLPVLLPPAFPLPFLPLHSFSFPSLCFPLFPLNNVPHPSSFLYFLSLSTASQSY